MGRQPVDEKSLRPQYVELYYQVIELLKKVEKHLAADEYVTAEGWLEAADVFFGKTAVFYIRLQKTLKSAKEKKELLEEMYDLQGHLEGARDVIRDAYKK